LLVSHHTSSYNINQTGLLLTKYRTKVRRSKHPLSRSTSNNTKKSESGELISSKNVMPRKFRRSNSFIIKKCVSSENRVVDAQKQNHHLIGYCYPNVKYPLNDSRVLIGSKKADLSKKRKIDMKTIGLRKVSRSLTNEESISEQNEYSIGVEKSLIQWELKEGQSWSDVKKIIDFKEHIGTGTFGKVYLAFYNPLNKLVAVKVLPKSSTTRENLAYMVGNEVQAMRNLNHKYIVKFYRLLQDQKRIYLIMEYAGSANLNSDEILSNLTTLEIEEIFKQLLSTIRYMHFVGIAHCDLKVSNIMYSVESKEIKVIDFGFSQPINKRSKIMCGTPAYMAPEIINQEEHSGEKGDVWALGVILYKLLERKYPFGGSHFY